MNEISCKKMLFLYFKTKSPFLIVLSPSQRLVEPLFLKDIELRYLIL